MNGRLFLSVLMMAALFISCRKNEFDEPPVGGTDPDLTANMNIDSLKRIYRDTVLNFNAIVPLTQDWIIMATVIADDKSGNLYKNMVIDDGTAGISIRIDQSNFYSNYPVGRRVFINLKGMAIGHYGGSFQLGGFKDTLSVPNELAPVPSSLLFKYIIPGRWGLEVTPIEANFDDLDENQFELQNRLVILKEVEFEDSYTEVNYADAVSLTSINRYIQECTPSNQFADVAIRTSGYAKFANEVTPYGKGNITGIFSVYNGDLQLTVRDLNDVDLGDVRCDGSTSVSVYNTIANVKGFFPGLNDVPVNTLIRAVVISDRTTNHTNGQNLIVQDSTGAVLVRFDQYHGFALGDSLEIKVGGTEYTLYNGWLEIDNVALPRAKKVGTGTIVPRLVTIADINANMATTTDSWESSVVTIMNVTISGGDGTYGDGGNGSRTLSDGTGTVTLYTAAGATFKSDMYPLTPVTLTGIISEYQGTTQIGIRNLNDVQP